MRLPQDWQWLVDWAGDERWLVAVVVLLLGALLADIVQRWIVARLKRHAQRTRSVWDDVVVAALGSPVSLLIWVFALVLTLEIAGARVDWAVAGLADKLRTLGIVVAAIWFGVRLAKGIEAGLIRKYVTPGAETGPDRTTIDAVGKLLRAVVVIAGGLVAVQSLGFSISGVLAFGGVGGLAVGFAARDLLANLFGGVIVHMDRPFAVGDWIRSPEREIEGTVETIGWRLARVRTFDMRPLYIPNSVFATVVVENPSRMSHRRIYETLGVRYQDVTVVDAIVRDIRAMLEGRDDVDDEQPLIVNLVSFGPSSLEIMIYCLVTEKRWVAFHALKEDVMLTVAGIVRQHGAEIAYPTTTLHVASLPGGEPVSGAWGEGDGTAARGHPGQSLQ